MRTLLDKMAILLDVSSEVTQSSRFFVRKSNKITVGEIIE